MEEIIRKAKDNPALYCLKNWNEIYETLDNGRCRKHNLNWNSSMLPYLEKKTLVGFTPTIISIRGTYTESAALLAPSGRWYFCSCWIKPIKRSNIDSFKSNLTI